MDKHWTKLHLMAMSEFLDNDRIILYNQQEIISAEVAELADAQDLKS